jgi:hypothetical protein
MTPIHMGDADIDRLQRGAPLHAVSAASITTCVPARHVGSSVTGFGSALIGFWCDGDDLAAYGCSRAFDSCVAGQ